MKKIIDFFGRVRPKDSKGSLDEQGRVTPRGRELLSKMGVVVGENVQMAASTLANLIGVYNGLRVVAISHDSSDDALFKGIQLREEDRYLYTHLERITDGGKKLAIKIGTDTAVGEHVTIQQGVSIGKGCSISDKCEIGCCSTMRDHVRIEKGVFVGVDCDIHSAVEIGEGANIAPRMLVGRGKKIEADTVFKENPKYDTKGKA